MTKHLPDCEFENMLTAIKRNQTFHNSVFVYKNQIVFSDGWNDSITIDINYCPICGAKLKGE